MDKFDKTLNILLQDLSFDELKSFSKQLNRFLYSAKKDGEKIEKINSILQQDIQKNSQTFTQFNNLINSLKTSTFSTRNDIQDLIQDYIIDWEDIIPSENFRVYKEQLDKSLNIIKNGVEYNLRQVLYEIFNSKFLKMFKKEEFCKEVVDLLDVLKTNNKSISTDQEFIDIPLAKDLFQFTAGTSRPMIGKGEFLLTIIKNLTFSKEGGCDLQTEGTTPIFYQVKNLTGRSGSVIECKISESENGEEIITLAPRFSGDPNTLYFIFFDQVFPLHYFVKDYDTMLHFLTEYKNTLPEETTQNGGGYRIKGEDINKLFNYTYIDKKRRRGRK